MVVTDIAVFDTYVTTLFESKESKLNKIVDKHILMEGQEGQSNVALKASIHYGIVGYLSIIEHEYQTSELTLDEIKEKFNFDELYDSLYKLGYNLNEIINDYIAIIDP